MAQAQTVKYSLFKIEISNGASPAVYAAPCGMNSRGFNRTAATNDTNVPFCDDDDKPSWLERDVVSLSGSLSGAGVVADEDFDTWEEFLGNSKNVRVTLGNRVWIGACILTKLDISGSRGKRTEFTATMDTDGEMVLQ